jgi:cobalt-zinc-cadmium efflux system membrane fusion protein
MMLSLAGCSDDPAPAAEAPKLPPGIVKPEENLKRTLKVAPVAASPFSEMLRVAGRIDFDEQRVSRIGASVTGRVTDLYAVLGQEVKAGQVLARLHSSELGAAQMAFLKAEAQNDLQARNAERARQLFAADVIGRAELQRRESEYAIAAAEMRAYRDQLRVLGMSAAAIATLAKNGSIDSYSPVFSSISGTVVERNVAQGQVVQPADALYTVADLSRVWVSPRCPSSRLRRWPKGRASISRCRRWPTQWPHHGQADLRGPDRESAVAHGAGSHRTREQGWPSQARHAGHHADRRQAGGTLVVPGSRGARRQRRTGLRGS